ncbi:MAG: hypothetical protein QOF00_5910, partial [Pseudonocardiales bacterium]|nr:hypothetical protein [Pseudonocardiales bacterium]
PQSPQVQWDTASPTAEHPACVKEDQTVIDPGATHLLGAAQNGHLPPGWPKSENCIYLGGYGIGPARAATGVDPYAGVHVRSVAVSNGDQTIVWQMLDMVGFFSRYRSDLCPEGCGMLDIREAIANGTKGKVPVANVAVAATHSHGGADGYGAWGGLPDWYRKEIRDQAVKSAYDALRALKPASISIGGIDARSFSNERRDTYYSAADYGATWMQARQLPTEAGGAAPVIATLVNFAAHPTMLGSSNTLMHGDWPGTAAKEMHDRFGGVGLLVEGGLGNVSPSAPRGTNGADLNGDTKVDGYDNVIRMARDFTSFIGTDIAKSGYALTSNVIKTKTETIEHPVTNWGEVGLGVVNLLDREFLPGTVAAGGPNHYEWDKGGPPGRGCVAVAPTTIKTDVSAFRIGELIAVTGPGEVFGTMAEVAKSKGRSTATATDANGDVVPAGQTMVFGQTQDSLGYIIQHFEVDPAGGVTSNAGLGEYEEEFMLDRCFGDHVLQTQLSLLDGVK